MANTYVILAVLVVGIILIIYAFTTIFHSGAQAPSKSTSTPASTSGAATATAPPPPPAVVTFYDVNVQYAYYGPVSKNGINCSYTTYTYIDSQSLTLNGSQPFNLQFQPGSGQCPFTITSVVVNTPGFAVTSTTPGTPFTLPPNSQYQLQVNMRAPSTSFYGPLTITINYR